MDAQWDAEWQQKHPGEGVRPVGYHGEGGGGGGSSGSFEDLAARALRVQQEANKPAIASLEAGIPTTQAAFTQQGQFLTQQQTPLQQRYDALISGLTAGSAKASRDVGINTSREFGARGIPTASGAYDQYYQNQLIPVNAAWAGTIGGAQAEKSQQLLNLSQAIAAVPTQSAQAVQAIRNAIAQLQAGANQAAVTGALNAYLEQIKGSAAAQVAKIQQAYIPTYAGGGVFATGANGSTPGMAYTPNAQLTPLTGSGGGGGGYGGGLSDTDFNSAADQAVDQFNTSNTDYSWAMSKDNNIYPGLPGLSYQPTNTGLSNSSGQFIDLSSLFGKA